MTENTESKTAFKVGDVVHLGFFKDAVYPSPAMVVVEVFKNTKDVYDEQTGFLQNNEKANCIWYNYKTGLYEERWFYVNVLAKSNINQNDNLVNLQTIRESQKKMFIIRSSFELFFTKKGEAKNSIFLSPPMSLLDIVKEPNKPPNKYDQKTGDQIRWTTAHEERAKCIWFNPLTGKYSEGLFILEALQMIDITKPKPQ